MRYLLIRARWIMMAKPVVTMKVFLKLVETWKYQGNNSKGCTFYVSSIRFPMSTNYG